MPTLSDTPPTPVTPEPTSQPPQPGGAGENRSDTRSTSRTLLDRVRDSAAAQLAAQKHRATDELDSVAQAVRSSTQQLRDQEHGTVAGYVEEAAAQIEHAADVLRSKDLPDMFDDVQRFARRQPVVFIGSAFAIGLLCSRFLKSSSEHERFATQPPSTPGVAPGGTQPWVR